MSNFKQNPQDRVRNAIANINEPHVCKECGGTFFTEHQAYQYIVSDYQVRGASMSPQKYYLCIGCGTSLVPGSLKNMAHVGGEREAFLNSVELGKAYKAKHDASHIIKNTASIAEVETLTEEVNRLNEIVTGLLEVVAESHVVETSVDKTEVTDQHNTPAPVEKITRRTRG